MFKIISKKQLELYKALECEVDFLLSSTPDPLLEYGKTNITTEDRLNLLKIYSNRLAIQKLSNVVH